jgi:CheY-like chemotaxis protein
VTSPRIVLVVEDDQDIQDSMRMVLEEEGFAVYGALNGREALEGLKNQAIPRPCMMLVDLMMPVMNGWELIKELEKDEALKGIPTAVVSAIADSRAAHLPSSVARFLAKPVQLQRLLDVMNELCPVTD